MYIWVTAKINPVLDGKIIKIMEGLVTVPFIPHVSCFNHFVDVVANILVTNRGAFLWRSHSILDDVHISALHTRCKYS